MPAIERPRERAEILPAQAVEDRRLVGDLVRGARLRNA
jgi:hypothetical protein